MFLLVASRDVWGGVGNLTWGLKGLKREHGNDTLTLKQKWAKMSIFEDFENPPKKSCRGGNSVVLFHMVRFSISFAQNDPECS